MTLYHMQSGQADELVLIIVSGLQKTILSGIVVGTQQQLARASHESLSEQNTGEGGSTDSIWDV